MRHYIYIIGILIAALNITSCEERTFDTPPYERYGEKPFFETFEGDANNKGSYSQATFKGVSATWSVFGVITDVVDQYNQDKKNDTRAARLRDPNNSNPNNTHFIEMVHDKPYGVKSISLYHGMYGANSGQAKWKLEISDNGGNSWDAFTYESEVVPVELTKITIEDINIKGNIRIRILKVKTDATTASSINIDDIEITDYR